MKTKKTVKKKKSYNLLMYVVDCSPRIKKFGSLKEMQTFIDDFNKKYPEEHYGDNWIDYVVTNVHGSVRMITSGISVE